MNKRLKEILQRKAEIRSALEGNEQVDLDAFEKELRELDEEYEAVEKREKLMQQAEQINNGELESRTISTFNMTGQPETRSPEESELAYRNAFMDFVLRDAPIPTELRETTNTGDIGSVIPQTVLNRIIEKLDASGMILPLITNTSFKGGLTIPLSTVKPKATWVAEGSGSANQKKTTGSITFNYHKLRCAVAVTLEVETMALAVFEQVLVNNIVEAMTIALEQAIISGDGIGKPKGILAETPNEGQLLDVAKIEYQTLVDVEAALPLEYETNAVYVMTKKTFMKMASIKDENGQPIGRVNYGIAGAIERSLLGRSVVLCNYLDSFDSAATGNPFAFLYNFKDYILNTNYQMGVKKYEDNETDDLVTKAIMIADGKSVDNGSLVVLNKAAAI
ncbi:phage major capsid protein [Kurthia sp. Dielmo]|uniref:phage major capsid protein n=1 Tax=Kurthia sp. Dielmo TaxID=1033738 RepID=UPI0002FB2FDF|nr:phage major capsid protein [Kurthia sp. Dielmo]